MRIIVLFLLHFLYCAPTAPPENTAILPDTLRVDSLTQARAKLDTVPDPTPDFDTTQWLELTRMDTSIQLDIRYATANNFVGEVLYDCGRCFLRPSVARAVIAAHQELQKQGLGLKMYDCYRPRPIQYKMWKIFPKPGYVANPDKGSIHNRGGAVDLTIVDSLGQELSMGTDYDFFGPKANHTYTQLPQEVLANRRMLQDLMDRHGLARIRTEWWHYNYRLAQYELAEWVWPCN
jgi:D-alanyl-D-alanine dipeptidase